MDTDRNTAYISNEGRYTVFRFGEDRLKFIGPYSLEKYLSVVEWDKGYLAVMTKYKHDRNPVEEYIDLIPILDNLKMDRSSFLAPIRKVEVAYD